MFDVPPGGRRADEVIARALVGRLTPAVPAGFTMEIREFGASVSAGVVDPDGWFSGHAWFRVHAEDEIVAFAAGRAEATLDAIQDHIAEATGDPWPGSGALPPPFVEVTHTVLRLGYGPSNAPVLELEPIPLELFRG